MLERLQQSTRRNLPGLWTLLAALLFVQILPLHVHSHAAGQEPALAHHHNVMSYLDDGGDDIADTQLQTIDLDLHGLYQDSGFDIPVLLFALVLLLALAACYRCLAVLNPQSHAVFPPGSYRLPPLRAPPIR